MATLLNNKNISPPLSEVLSISKYDSTTLSREVLRRLRDMTNGVADQVDATTPSTFLLESCMVAVAESVKESMSLHRSLYPNLAISEQELHNHVSTADNINRFSVPVTTNFTLLVGVNSLKNVSLPTGVPNQTKITIPRDTEIIASNLVFTTGYPIDITVTTNGVDTYYEVKYDFSVINPILIPKTQALIPHTIVDTYNFPESLSFTIPLTQYSTVSTTKTVSSSTLFSVDIPYTNNFYTAVVYQLLNGTWEQIVTTHGDIDYNREIPTAILTVTEGNLNVTIPQIYSTNNLISNEVRIDLMTSNGKTIINLSELVLNDYRMSVKNIDSRLSTGFTESANSVEITPYSVESVGGGITGKSLSVLRNEIINNSYNHGEVPITELEIGSYVSNLGYSLLKIFDGVINRTYTISRELPVPVDNTIKIRNTITSAVISLTIDDAIKNGWLMVNTTNSIYPDSTSRIPELGNLILIPSNTMFRDINNQMNIVSLPDRLEYLKGNDPDLPVGSTPIMHDIYYNPFYYLIDVDSTPDSVRVFELDNPTIGSIDNISNTGYETYQCSVRSFSINKLADSNLPSNYRYGYRMIMETVGAIDYNNIGLNTQFAYLTNTVNGKTTQIDGIIDTVATTSTTKVFYFDIHTDNLIDSFGDILIDADQVRKKNNIVSTIPLSSTYKLYLATTSPNITDLSDIAHTELTLDPTLSFKVLNLTTIDIKLGEEIKNMWTKIWSDTNTVSSGTYTTDVYKTYLEDVYSSDTNATSASRSYASTLGGQTGYVDKQFIFNIDTTNPSSTNCVLSYKLLHSKGEQYLDNNGNPIIQHKAGDPLPLNHPDSINTSVSPKFIDMVLFEGAYLVANSNGHINYRKTINNAILNWINKDVPLVDNKLLNTTSVYYYPYNTAGIVSVDVGGGEIILTNSSQSPVVNVYVPLEQINNEVTKQTITNAIYSVMDETIGLKAFTLTEVNATIYNKLNNYIISARVSLPIKNDLESIRLVNDNERLSLAKKLITDVDGVMTVIPDIEINVLSI